MADRTHNGILGCASEIVSIVLDLFPNAVDRLQKDCGHFNGPKPRLLTETTADDLAILLVGSDETQSQIEFGAHQAVLVRSQAAKDTLPEEFDGALVLTIFEAKGLEFDDVFIYNFFADSPADERTWRVITSWWEERCPGVRGSAELGPQLRAVAFDREKHGILEEELKQLYTAITRARVRVAMYDQSREKRQPVFSYLHGEGLAEIEAVDASHAERTGWAKAATKEEWLTRGRNLFDNKLYKLAARCFANGDDRDGMLRSLGFQYYDESTKLQVGTDQQQRVLRATFSFLEAGELKLASSCLAAACEYELAAKAQEWLGMPDQAAKMLVRGAEKLRRQGTHAKALGLLAKAAAVYERADRQTDALAVRITHKELHKEALQSLDAMAQHSQYAELLRFALVHFEKKKNWDACLQVCGKLRSAGLAVDDARTDAIAQTAAFSHRKNGERRLMLAAVKQFSQPLTQLQFLQDVGETHAAIEMLLALGHLREAADLLLIAAEETKPTDRDQAKALLEQAESTALKAGDSGGAFVAKIIGAREFGGEDALAELHLTVPEDDSFLLLWLFALPKDRVDVLWTMKKCKRLLDRIGGESNIARTCFEPFLRLRGQPLQNPSMPTWCWLCELVGHDRQDVRPPSSAEFQQLLAQAVQAVAAMQLATAVLRAQEQLKEHTLASEKSSERSVVCAPKLSSDYCSTLSSMLGALQAGQQLYLTVRARSRWGPLYRVSSSEKVMECVDMIIRVLFVDAHPQHETPVEPGVLPAGCHHLARHDLLEWLTLDRNACNLLIIWAANYWSHQPVDQKFWNLRLSSLVHQISTGPPRIAFGVFPIHKQLEDKIRSLHPLPHGSDFPHRNIIRGNAPAVKLLPGKLLAAGLFLETKGLDGNLADALRKQID